MTDPTTEMLQFFQFAHLPPDLQAASQPFCVLAHDLHGWLPAGPEKTMAFRKLLEAKDCAARAVLAARRV